MPEVFPSGFIFLWVTAGCFPSRDLKGFLILWWVVGQRPTLVDLKSKACLALHRRKAINNVSPHQSRLKSRARAPR
jgi:hypothetical protein